MGQVHPDMFSWHQKKKRKIFSPLINSKNKNGIVTTSATEEEEEEASTFNKEGTSKHEVWSLFSGIPNSIFSMW